MAREAAFLAGRCIEAGENGGVLDLSECQLMQVPDAVYHLLRNTLVLSCNLASNTLSKISSKFVSRFTNITELNLSHNKMAILPDEMSECTQLEKLDIGYNSFIDIPNVIFRLPKVKLLLANNNFIIDVDVGQLPLDSSIEEVDLQENPLIPSCHDMLTQVTSVRVILSPRDTEEWENLNI